MSGDYIRICPVCETVNPPDRLRCACGGLLAGIDFSLRPAAPEAVVEAPPEPPPVAELPPDPVAAGPVCPYADCAMPNPPGQERCLYCDRSLADAADPAGGVDRHSPLPPTLARRFRAARQFHASGAEADLMLVEPLAGGEAHVAKLYRAGLAPDTELLAKLNEADAAHVVRLIEHGVADGVPYELMEFCPLGTLRGLLASGHLTRARLREIVAELADAIAEVHRLGILHRDLKPENVLVRALQPLDLALADFGIASLRQATQHFTGAARTVHYAAPEALTGVLDEKADWWSLGMMALEAANGRHPFDGLNEQVAAYRLATHAIDTGTVFDDDLRKLCRGLLLRDPKRRWGGVEVKRWLAGDTSLEAPGEAGDGQAAAHPYRIGDAECRNLVELALALARHWEHGAKDLRRGSVGAWIERELHDYDLARRLHGIVESDSNDDRALLRFLLAVAPNQPPTWRGTPIDRANLLAMASKAAGGDLTARTWLDSIHLGRILTLCTEAGHAALGEFGGHWQAALKRFDAVWRQAQDAERQWRGEPKSMDGEAGTQVVDVDALLYGPTSHMESPRSANLHPYLLLVLAYPQYVDSLRNEVLAGRAELADRCPWFDVFGDLGKLDAVAILAARLALPTAREDAGRERVRRDSAQKHRAANTDELKRELAQVLRRFVELARRDRLGGADLTVLLVALHDTGAACRRALGFGYLDDIAADARERIEATHAQCLDLVAVLYTLESARAIDMLWLTQRRLSLGGVILFGLGTAFGAWFIVPAIAVGAGAIAWRWRRIAGIEAQARRELHRLRSQAYATLNLLDDEADT